MGSREVWFWSPGRSSAVLLSFCFILLRSPRNGRGRSGEEGTQVELRTFRTSVGGDSSEGEGHTGLQ